jgi:serine/threonine-protein kinase
LAYSLDRQKRLDEAERLMREAVAMLRAVYPSGHPRLAQALRLHGLVLEHMQRFEDAKPLLREAISTATAFDGEHGVIVVDSELDLALALAMTKAFAESESYCRKALASLLMKYAATSPLTQRADLCLGDALLGQGQYAEAERLLLGARESVLSGKGIGGLKLASVNSVLVRLYEAQGRQSEAAKYRVAPAP